MYLRKPGKSRTRVLLSWFFLGMLLAAALFIILTPLLVRSLPPRAVARLPGFLQCLHPDFCRGDAEPIPGVPAPVGAADLLSAPNEAAPPDPTVTLMPTHTPPTDAPLTVDTQPAQPTPPPPTEAALPPLASPTPVAVAAADTLPQAAQLRGFQHIFQKYNNCGPSSVSMIINYWGYPMDQDTAAAFLKPEWRDNNVTPMQLADFVNQRVPNLNAVYRFAGDLTLLKRLVLAGYPVIVETGYTPSGYGWFGHHRLITGYSDIEGSFYVLDSFSSITNDNRGYAEAYERLDDAWQQFNRVYVVVYPPEAETQIANILGDDWDPARNAENALRIAQTEAQQDPSNPFAWFNMGTAFVWMEEYGPAATAYDEARNLGTLPPHMLWYQFGPFEAYLNTNRPNDVLVLTEANLNGSAYLEESHYYRGLAYVILGRYAEAEREFQEALDDNHNFTPAQQALEEVRQRS